MGKRESFNRQLLYLVLILVLLVVAVIGAGVAFLQALAGM
jgi:type III secretory pathway component EscS